MKSLGVRLLWCRSSLLLVLVLTLGDASIAAASSGEQDAATSPDQSASQGGDAPDFLFGRPHGSVAFRGAWVFARAGSDLFDFVRQNLTIDRKDFNAPAFAMDLGIALTPRIDSVFGFDVSQASVGSEYRHFVDNRRQPITQEPQSGIRLGSR